MDQTTPIKIGWAQASLIPDHLFSPSGQMYYRAPSYVHDPTMAQVLVLDNSETRTAFVSMDLVGINDSLCSALVGRIESDPELAGLKVSCHATHTHNACAGGGGDGGKLGPDLEEYFSENVFPDYYDGRPTDVLEGEKLLSYLTDMLYHLICRAWDGRTFGGVSNAQDYAVVAFNRRPIFGCDGSEESIMYGDCSRDDFIRLEGGADHAADMLYTWDLDGNLTGVMVCVPCPSQVCELHHFISGDYWTYTRAALRERFGNIYVLPCCGAAGDQNPLDLIRISKDNKQQLPIWGAQESEVWRNLDMTEACMAIGERVCDAVARGYKKARNYIDYTPAFSHEQLVLELPIRLVSEADYQEAKTQMDEMKQRYVNGMVFDMKVAKSLFEPMGVITRWNVQNKATLYPCPVQVLRIGGLAIATSPFELFVEFGLRIKARAKAHQVMLIQLANGTGGYLPTAAAISGGSYSSKPASTTCGPESGDILVEKTLEAIDGFWA